MIGGGAAASVAPKIDSKPDPPRFAAAAVAAACESTASLTKKYCSQDAVLSRYVESLDGRTHVIPGRRRCSDLEIG